MKNLLLVIIIFMGLISSAFEVEFNSSDPTEVKYNDSGEVSFLRFGIEEVVLGDSEVIVMTKGMYRSLTNKINMLTYWCEKSYKVQCSTIQGLEQWHGKKVTTIITNGTCYIKFSDGFIYEDKDGRMNPKTRLETIYSSRRKRPDNSDKPKNRTKSGNILPWRPVTKGAKSLSRSKRPTESDISEELKNIKESRVKNVTTTNEVTIVYGPGRKVIDEK